MNKETKTFIGGLVIGFVVGNVFMFLTFGTWAINNLIK